MYRRNKNQVDDQLNSWMSFTDLLAALFLIVVIAWVSTLNHNKSVAEILDVRETIALELIEAFTLDDNFELISNNDTDTMSFKIKNGDAIISIHKLTGKTRIKNGIIFDSDSYYLKQESKDFIDKFFPIYQKVLLDEKNNKFISNIIVEGHTYSVNKFMKELELSQKRAYSVTKYILEEYSKSYDKNDPLTEKLTPRGRSSLEMISEEFTRRVEFDFLLDENKIREELGR